MIEPEPHRLGDVGPHARGLREPLGARADQHEGQAEAAKIVDIVGHRIDDCAVDTRLPQCAQVAAPRDCGPSPTRRPSATPPSSAARSCAPRATSAQKGLAMSGMTRPINPDRPERIPTARWLRS